MSVLSKVKEKVGRKANIRINVIHRMTIIHIVAALMWVIPVSVFF